MGIPPLNIVLVVVLVLEELRNAVGMLSEQHWNLVAPHTLITSLPALPRSPVKKHGRASRLPSWSADAADPERLGGSLVLPQGLRRHCAITAPLRFAVSVVIASI